MASRPNVLVEARDPGATRVRVEEFVEKSPWSGEYSVFNMIIYGDPGTGKTPLACSAVEVKSLCPVLLIDCDSGTLSVRKYEDLPTFHLPVVARKLSVKLGKAVSEWVALEQVYAWLMFGEHPFVTVILDGGTDLQRFCEMECIAKGIELKASAGKEHDPELAELGDYRRIYERMKRTYIRFRDLITADGRRINFVATAHERHLKDEWTGKVSVLPAFLGQGAFINMSVFDIVGRLMVVETGGKATKYFVPCLEGKTRGRDRSFSLTEKMQDPTMTKIVEKILGGGISSG